MRYLAVLLMVVTLLVAVPQGASAATSRCSEQAIAVSLTDGGPADQVMHGQLCLPRSRRSSTVQLLVHGGTYNHTYWDFPVKPYLYSYVRYANAAGFATFSVDLLGTGSSSHPHSGLVNISSSAVALHQVITKLRAGGIGPVAYQKVIYVGHSLGVAAGWLEAGTYRDIDAFISTGAPHALSSIAVSRIAVVPASADPLFAPLNLDDGYLSVTRATRELLVYLPTADPQVVRADWETRDVLTLGTQLEGISFFVAPPAANPTRNIDVPVLVMLGDKDFLYCQPDALDCGDYQAVRQNEAGYYLSAPSLDVVLVPQTGHDLNLQLTAPFSFTTMVGWASRHAAP